MITSLEIKKQLTDLQYEVENTKLKKSKITRIKNRMAFLKLIDAYMQGGVDEFFIDSKINRLEKRINLLYEAGFNEETDRVNKGYRKEFEKENDIPKIRQQLKALRFIKK